MKAAIADDPGRRRSVALKWYLVESGAEPARQILADDDRLVAPELVFAEVCNACWLACRRGEISAVQQAQIAVDITRIFDRLEALVPHAARAVAIARELDHPVRLLLPGSQRSARCAARDRRRSPARPRRGHAVFEAHPRAARLHPEQLKQPQARIGRSPRVGYSRTRPALETEALVGSILELAKLTDTPAPSSRRSTPASSCSTR